MNLMAALTAIAAVLRALSDLFRQWRSVRQENQAARDRAKGAAYDRLSRAIEARNRMRNAAGSDSLQKPAGDRWRRK
jgi:hypothetical protein